MFRQGIKSRQMSSKQLSVLIQTFDKLVKNPTPEEINMMSDKLKLEATIIAVSNKTFIADYFALKFLVIL